MSIEQDIAVKHGDLVPFRVGDRVRIAQSYADDAPEELKGEAQEMVGATGEIVYAWGLHDDDNPDDRGTYDVQMDWTHRLLEFQRYNDGRFAEGLDWSWLERAS